MSNTPRSAPLQPGEKAPDFSLPAVHQAGSVSLSDYLARGPVLVAIFRGLYCPFCRRAIARLDAVSGKLRQAGAEALAIVATDAENARLYFKLRPAKMAVGADPECATHHAFGVPEPVPDAQLMQTMQTTRINPTGELSEALPVLEAGAVMNRMDGYTETASDQRDRAQHGTQLKGQFLLDRQGIVRWMNIEGAQEGPSGLGKFPSDAELLDAVKSIA
ncbi:MAG: peroxiredoxin-like family protein [Burkholderiales bacterium]|nr:peroxiredoxin-like family protein [Burkholderiales bacterium]